MSFTYLLRLFLILLLINDVINAQNTLIPFRTDSGGCGYKTVNGNIIVPPIYNETYPFSEGIGVAVGKYNEIYDYKMFDTLYFFNQNGELLKKLFPYTVSCKIECDLCIYPNMRDGMFTNGLLPVGIASDTNYYSEAKWGFMNKNGDFVIKPEYYATNGFTDGLAPVCKRIFKKNDIYGKDKWFYIDTTGKKLKIGEFDGAYRFTEGLALVWKFKFGLGFINKTGKWVIKPKYSEAFPFYEGLAAAAITSKDTVYYGWNILKWGFIDKFGKWVIKPKFLMVTPFLNGIAKAGIGTVEQYIDEYTSVIFKGKIVEIDKTGKIIRTICEEEDEGTCDMDIRNELMR
jgi:hypothetical protein